MITAIIRHEDQRSEVLESMERIANASAEADAQLWIDLDTPSAEEVHAIGELFQFDRESLEDCLTGDQRPRIDEFEGHIFLVLYGAVGVEQVDQFDPRKLAAFLSGRLLVTVHRDPLVSVRAVREKCQRQTAQMLGKGVDFILYTIIDAMVDRYVNIADGYERQLDELEERSLVSADGSVILAPLSSLRRELVELKHIAVSKLELLAPLARGEFDYISESLEARFRHVRDHLRSVIDQVEGQRELLHAIRDNYHSAVANRTNDVMKVLTITASLFIPLTFLAGIYGMNFEHMPELKWPWAYPVLLILMVATVVGMLVYFRHKGWISTRREDERPPD